jgi:hypothetical protein
MFPPSEDQSVVTKTAVGLMMNGSSAPVPPAPLKYKLLIPARSDRKTIRAPSGDQMGAASVPGSNVSRVFALRTRSSSQISGVWVSGSTTENTIRF